MPTIAGWVVAILLAAGLVAIGALVAIVATLVHPIIWGIPLMIYTLWLLANMADDWLDSP